MPNYVSNGQAQLLFDNRQAILWNSEAVVAGNMSIAVQLERRAGAFYPWGASFEVVFSGNPGTFELDIVGANTDNILNYVVLGSITGTNNGYGTPFTGYVGRWDMPTSNWPKYVAGYMKSITNAVNTILTVQR